MEDEEDDWLGYEECLLDETDDIENDTDRDVVHEAITSAGRLFQCLLLLHKYNRCCK